MSINSRDQEGMMGAGLRGDLAGGTYRDILSNRRFY